MEREQIFRGIKDSAIKSNINVPQSNDVKNGILGLRGKRERPNLGGGIRDRLELPEEFVGPTCLRREMPPSIGLPSIHFDILKKTRKIKKEPEDPFKPEPEPEPPEPEPVPDKPDYKPKNDYGNGNPLFHEDKIHLPLNQFTEAWAQEHGSGAVSANGGGGFQPEQPLTQEIPYNLLIYGFLGIIGLYLLTKGKK